MAGEQVDRITLRCEDEAPTLARQRLAELDGLGWLLGDAMLVASELVTNAVRHSGCLPEDRLVVSVSRADGHLRLAVRDPGRSGSSARISPESPWFGGLGLKIVNELGSRWGTNRDRGGYEVWADLPVAGTGHTEHQRRPARGGCDQDGHRAVRA